MEKSSMEFCPTSWYLHQVRCYTSFNYQGVALFMPVGEEFSLVGTQFGVVRRGLCGAHGPIILFHKSQCALRYLDPMSKIQNASSQRSLATWLTVVVNEQDDDWPAPVSLVSVQPVIGWFKDEIARHWSHIVHRPRPHCNLPLPCIVRNCVWYCIKYSSLKSSYVLQSHPASIPNHKMKFCGSVVWVRWQQIEKCISYFDGLSQVFIF